MPANDTARVDIPTVQVEPLPIGTSTVHPGTPDVPLLVLRLENHRPQTAILSALHLAVGTGLTRLRLWRDDEFLYAEVSDGGRIDRPLAGRERPSREHESGRGLWIANQLCELVQVRSFPDGNAVRLHMRLD